jgi:Insertion element 4 transposase N-terminal
MARRAMTMSSGGRIAEHLSVGILARSYPRKRIRKILEELGLQSKRVRDLPAEVLVYYVIALGLFMAVSTGEVLRSLVEGLQWLGGRSRLKVAGKAAISQGRSKLGVAPLKALWEQSVAMLAVEGQPGCFYRGLRLVAIDGSTLDVPDTEENLAYFGRQRSSRGQAAFPQMRFVSLCECGPHAIFALRMGAYSAPESSLAQELVRELKPGMLCLADRLYSNFGLWQKAVSSGATLLWRMRGNAKLPVEKVLEDGSYLSRIYPSQRRNAKSEAA